MWISVEPLWAELTLEWLFSCVYPKMTCKSAFLCKVLMAELTREWFFSCVYPKVTSKMAISSKGLTAELTLEWLLSCVYGQVTSKNGRISKWLWAIRTLQNFCPRSIMCSLMPLHYLYTSKTLPTVVTLDSFFLLISQTWLITDKICLSDIPKGCPVSWASDCFGLIAGFLRCEGFCFCGESSFRFLCFSDIFFETSSWCCSLHSIELQVIGLTCTHAAVVTQESLGVHCQLLGSYHYIKIVSMCVCV